MQGLGLKAWQLKLVVIQVRGFVHPETKNVRSPVEPGVLNPKPPS